MLNDDRAIVSKIPGTTRDTIEDTFNIDGVIFRFIDTAGIRLAEDEVESYGIERTFKAIEKADIILYMVDINKTTLKDVEEELLYFENEIDFLNKRLIIVANKIDELNEMPHHFSEWNDLDIVYISAKRKVNLNYIHEILIESVNSLQITNQTLLTNTRHYDSMIQIQKSLEHILEGIEANISTDLLAADIRTALNAIGTVTGEIANEDLLNHIFSKFCIGK
jgi:tRNA modification GTPase